jgi:murein DD-endopeptidase MepM/ murein hydrolase activator NlpD
MGLMMKNVFKKVLIITMLTVLAIISGTGNFSARAGLDELLREDVPYFNLPPVGGCEPQIYLVQPGDTLISIAARFGVKIDLLASANRLADLNCIEAGRELVIPGGTIRHKVLPGETLTRIAGAYGVPLEELAKINNLTDRDLLFAGQNLLIPAGGRAALPAWNPTLGLPVDELVWPVIGWISSGFGLRDGRPHEGLDIAAEEGEPIRAVRSGRVVFAGNRGTYGLTVIIDHGGGLTTLYGHASAILVREGQWVREGQIIARVGSTGRSTGPHLHLEVRLNGVPYDPLLCLKRMYA